MNNDDTKATPAAAAAPGPNGAGGASGAAAAGRKRGFRAKRIIIPIVVFAAVAATGAYYWNTEVRPYDRTDDAYIDADRVSISSKIMGRIAELAVDEGDTVTAGEVLVRLDDADLRAQEAQVRAAIVSAEESVKLARVNVSKAEDDFRRAQRQYNDKIMPEEQYEHARKALETAQAQLAIAVAQVGTARAQRGVIETNLRNTQIASPMNGVVAKRWVLAGDVVQPSQPIFAVYDLAHVWVTANFEETKLGSMIPGAPVDIAVDAYAKERYRGAVLQVGTNTAAQFSLIPPNNASGNFTKITQRVPVKISIDREAGSQADRPLLPGMSVEVKVHKAR